MANFECEPDVTELYDLLQTERGGSFWSGILENQAWALIEFRTSPDIKIKVAHTDKDIFAKVFSPRAREYAQTAFDALIELANLAISVPILAPHSLCDTCLVFPLGCEMKTVAYATAYPHQEERTTIEKIVKKHDLNPLTESMTIGLVTLNGQIFAVDPFQDDANSIFEFNQKKKGASEVKAGFLSAF